MTAAPNRVKNRTQAQQVIDPKPGSTRRGLRKPIDRRHVSPARQHRAQTPPFIEIHHPILAPVLSPGRQHVTLPALRMKRVNDLEGDNDGFTTFRMADSC
jgi:hypothetical protein